MPKVSLILNDGAELNGILLACNHRYMAVSHYAEWNPFNERTTRTVVLDSVVSITTDERTDYYLKQLLLEQHKPAGFFRRFFKLAS